MIFLIFYSLTLMGVTGEITLNPVTSDISLMKVSGEIIQNPVLVFDNHQNVQCLSLGKYDYWRKPCEKKLPNFRCVGSISYSDPTKYLFTCKWKEVAGYAVTVQVNNDLSLSVNMVPHYDFTRFTFLIILILYITIMFNVLGNLLNTGDNWSKISFVIWLLWE